MTDKEKYDFIDHVVHLTLSVEDRLLNEHGGDYSGLEEDGIDSNEYYRIITERVINILKKNNNYMQEEPVSEDLVEVIRKYEQSLKKENPATEAYDFASAIRFGANWQKNQMMASGVDGVVHHLEKCKVASVHYNDPTGVPMVYITSPEGLSAGDKVKIIVIKED